MSRWKTDKDERTISEKVTDTARSFDRAYRKNQKAKDKKAKKNNKLPRPKGHTARKAGAITFWVLFSFMILVVFVNLLSSPVNSTATANDKKQANLATTPEAVQFAEDFTASYFTWNSGDKAKEEHANKLARFIGVGLDPNAGLKLEKNNWNSKFRGLKIKRIIEKGKNKAEITFLVYSELTKSNDSDAKNIAKYFVVPISYEENTFGIYSLPRFTYIDEETKVKAENPNQSAGINKMPNTMETENIRLFLETFFTTFTEDTPEKIAYMLEDKKHARGLNKSMKFVEVKNSDIYEGATPDRFIVYSEVIMSEPQTGMEFLSTYNFILKKENNRYIVTALNDENAIRRVIDAKK